MQQVLKTVPAVTGLQSTGQGAFGSADGAGTNAPTIHGLGASASNSTLVLINGHRLPVSGINHVLADPNIVAPLAIERVEVLADGASSVYGSDAVAGVINFITRRKYDGIDATIQRGFGHQYDTFSGGLLAGKTWDSGSVLVASGALRICLTLRAGRLLRRAREVWAAVIGRTFRLVARPLGAVPDPRQGLWMGMAGERSPVLPPVNQNGMSSPSTSLAVPSSGLGSRGTIASARRCGRRHATRQPPAPSANIAIGSRAVRLGSSTLPCMNTSPVLLDTASHTEPIWTTRPAGLRAMIAKAGARSLVDWTCRSASRGKSPLAVAMCP